MTLTQNYKFTMFAPKTEIFSKFYEICHSQQIEHANCGYNTHQCFERAGGILAQNDYRLKMIITCKI